jgi:uncharacterized ion transporter superfamily protein YfcC
VTDYGNGLYFFTLWADVAGVSGATLRQWAVENFGESYITDLGKFNRGINFGELKKQFQESIDGGASRTMPTRADINGALIKAAGYTPSVFSVTADVIKEDAAAIADFSLASLKVLAVVAIVGGVAYILFTTGAFRRAA